MKQQVKLSTYSTIISLLVLLALAAGAICILKNGYPLPAFILFAGLICICSAILFFMPLSIAVDDNAICINRSLWFKRIPLSEISSIELMKPTMGEKLLLGSKGCCGYWGWFSERDLGKYFAYYGKASDCFFVRLKDGRQYMLGCRNPQTITDYISKRISPNPAGSTQ